MNMSLSAPRAFGIDVVKIDPNNPNQAEQRQRILDFSGLRCLGNRALADSALFEDSDLVVGCVFGRQENVAGLVAIRMTEHQPQAAEVIEEIVPGSHSRVQAALRDFVLSQCESAGRTLVSQ